MISECRYVPIAENMQEMRRQGSLAFPCSAYRGEFEKFLSGEVPCHWHDEFEIFMLLKGEAFVRAGKETSTMTAGECLFINSGMLHSMTGSMKHPALYHSLVFSPILISGIRESVYELKYIRPLLESRIPCYRFEGSQKEEMIRLFEDAYDQLKKEEAGFELHVRNDLSLLLFQIGRQMEVNHAFRSDSVKEERMKQFLLWVDAHLSEEFAIADMAASAGLSARECERVFSDYLHVTPKEYINRRRIMKAGELLASSSMPVTEICYACGFESPAYFSKIFKRYTKRTPREYRKERSGL